MIKLESVTKKYGSYKAINDLDLEIEKGQIVGLLGPNGAGKTTTMRVMTGYLIPDEGTVYFDGKKFQSREEEIKRRIGYMPENNSLYKDMLVNELLQMTLSIRKSADREEKIDKAVKATGIAEVYYRPISELSKGYNQRVGIANALITDPDIVIMDEPTEGLDPNQRVEIRKLIKRLGKERTVMISTHVMQEVEAMCDRIVIINRGKVIADGSKEEIFEQAKGKASFSLKISGSEPEKIEERLQKITLVEKVKIEKQKAKTDIADVHSFNLTVSDSESFPEELGKVMRRNKWMVIHHMTQTGTSLEDIFHRLTKELKE